MDNPGLITIPCRRTCLVRNEHGSGMDTTGSYSWFIAFDRWSRPTNLAGRPTDLGSIMTG